MPFMKGPAPIRRTLRYLEMGKVVFKDKMRIFSVNYNFHGDHHKGAREFVFWHLPQIQYKNPSVQVITLKNMTPTPFIRCFLDDGEQILMDVDSKSKDEILEHVNKILGRSDAVLAAEARARQELSNPAHFGSKCSRHCICEIHGQIPCPAVVPLPKHMRGKYKFGQAEM